MQLIAGASHTCVVTGKGGVRCWGYNDSGQLGDGTTIDRPVPVDVIGLNSVVVALAGGIAHTCVVTKSGSVKCWGNNGSGQLGDNTLDPRLTPVDVVGLSSGVRSITAGRQHTCALLDSGAVKCWGANNSGQLGDSTNTQRLTPVVVSGLSSGVVAIVAGGFHTCALMTGGGVKCWGSNSNGALGTVMGNQSTPVDVSGFSSGIVAIVAGYEHTCVLTNAGGVKCWGRNDAGQAEDGGLSSGITAITAGWAHTCTLTNTGEVKCWGDNSNGQLGDGTTGSHTTPTDVLLSTNNISAIAAGDAHTCALGTDGIVNCWGTNNMGELGNGKKGNTLTPVDVSGLSSGVQALSVDAFHTCMLSTQGGIKCWGNNYSGQLGDGTTNNQQTPNDVSGLASNVSAVTVGDGHSCALTNDGGVKCWGGNYYHQLGDGTSDKQTTPVMVSGLTSGVRVIAARTDHSCAITTNGGLKCWGSNGNGQLGDGSTFTPFTPVDVSGLSSGVKSITLGRSHTCALLDTGGVKCWGGNSSGQIGNGTTDGQATPVDVSGLSNGVVAIAAGYFHTCALTTAGTVKCWGDNSDGQLGDNSSNSSPIPVDVSGLSNVVAISAGRIHTCALTNSGGVKCWGNNAHGELGDGTTTDRPVPGDVTGLTSDVKAIAAGYFYTCALLSNGGVKCWGHNANGRLGNGNAWSTTPQDVIMEPLASNLIYLPVVAR
ncbi:MAG: hypothetical protein U0175_18265 [Caldilineaceae bacterium]